MHEQEIRDLLQKQLPDAHIVIKNPLGDGMHFHALIISGDFEGVSLVERHRSITAPLREAFRDDTIHALSLKTYTPAEARNRSEVLRKFGVDPDIL